MLFNSYEFILLFLPLTLIVFFRLGSLGYQSVSISWLVLASFFFYAWWNPAYLLLILFSIIFNYSIGIILTNNLVRSSISNRLLLVIGISCNLGLIGYFKYFNFFASNANTFLGSNFSIEEIILPLAISFFTFQQITYLVDAYKGKTKEYNFLHYCLFVTFFPQLIAGPIVHHREMLPQFEQKSIYTFNYKNFTIGLTIFIIGLFKKVVIADGVANYSTPVFDAAVVGVTLTFYEAWIGALAYSFQLYFDFSGYSDMAIGLARMFGILLPLNFHSPYKAENIIDFWGRWHMTLSRFLKDYVYIPLGGNRKGVTRRYVNLICTMLLGGLWHGAGWTFVVWGGIHGLYLAINHAWRKLTSKFISDKHLNSKTNIFLMRGITFFAVVISWVIFRAEDMDSASSILSSMFGFNGIPLPTLFKSILDNMDMPIFLTGLQYGELIDRSYFEPGKALLWLSVLFFAVHFLPNTQQIMNRYSPALGFEKWKSDNVINNWWNWQPIKRWSVLVSILAILALLNLTQVSEFLYFQF